MKGKHNDPTRLIDKSHGSKAPRYDNLTRPAVPPTEYVDIPHTEVGGREDTISRPVSWALEVEAGVSGGSARPPQDDGRTRIFRGTRDATQALASSDLDPVTGWLVVVRGPGRGQALAVRYGQQGIGRDASQAICLDFGDQEISRSRHAGIVYDPKGRRFYVQPGEGTNLAYVDEAPVLAPTELTDGAELQLGQTALRFVALCGAEFSWDD